MKTLDFSIIQTEALTEAEAYNIQGGNLLLWAFITTQILYPIYANPQAHFNAFMQGFEEGFSLTR